MINQDLKKISDYNRSFQNAVSARQTWLSRAFEYEMVVHNDVEATGTQFTQKQIEEMKAKHLIGTSINFSLPIIEMLVAFLTASQPIPDTVPLGETSKEKAYVYREIIKGCLNTNQFCGEIQEQLIKDQCITGRGVLQIKPANYYNYNEFNVILESLDYRYYYPDSSSVLRSHQDSEIIFVAKPLTTSKAKKIYGLTDDECKLATSTEFQNYSNTYDTPFVSTFSNSSDDPTIWIQEIYEKEKALLYILQDGTKTFQKPQPYVDEQGILKSQILSEKKQVYIRRTIKIGNYIKDTELLPITMYPFIIYGHTHNRNPYEYGVVHNFVDLNYALNKFVGILTENAQQSSNSSLMAPEGSIDDPVKFQKDRSTPGGVATYNADASLPNGGAPVQNSPSPLSNAYYSLFNIMRELIEYVTGMNSLMQGNPVGAPDTVGATNTLTTAGLQRPKMYARRIDSSNSILGKLIVEMYQAFAPEENVIAYIDHTSAKMQITTNVMLKMQQTEQGQIFERSNVGEGQKATIIKNLETEEIKTIFGDINQGTFDVVFKSTNNLPTTRAQAIEFLKTLLGRMSSDTMSIAVIESLFKLADVAEADEVLRNMNAIGQAQQQVEQAQQQIEMMDKEIKQLEKQLSYQILATKEAEIESAVEIRKEKADVLLKEMGESVKEDQKEKEKAKLEYS